MSLSYRARRILAIKKLLTDIGIVDTGDLERTVAQLARRSPADGARVVARAWVEPEFRRRLLEDAWPAIEGMGFSLPQEKPGLAVLENTDSVRYLVVCTLCSCYPTTLLGPPPDWYKSLAYRSRAVREPREVMREFGLEIDEGTEVRVVDSTADLRYLVLPQRPRGTEGMSEEELAALVTRDSMIGVGDPLSPAAVAPGGDS